MPFFPGYSLIRSLLIIAGIPNKIVGREEKSSLPYILVGHSIAAFNILIYTHQYPQEVVGLVCVDCRAPTFASLVIEKWSPEQPDDPAVVKDFRKAYTQVFEDEYENFDDPTSQLLARNVTNLGNRPFVVLLRPVSPFFVAFGKWDDLMNEAWNESSIALSQLSSQSRI